MRIEHVIFISLLFAAFVCAQTKPSSGCDVKERFFEVDRAFSNLSERSGPLKAFLEFSTSDAYILPSKNDPAFGREAIRIFYSDFPADDKLTWEPIKAGCSSDGSLGYTVGKYEFEYRDSTGKAESHEGEYVTVWQRQENGSLKFIADMGHPQLIVNDEAGMEALNRKPIKTVKASDFQIVFGTFEVKERIGKNVKVVKRGNYITACRISPNGKKKVLVDFQN